MKKMDTERMLALGGQRLLRVTDRPAVVMVRGEGMWLYDSEGKKYLDFIGGWAVNALGHSPAAIAQALSRQAETLVNASPAFYNLPMIEFADLLLEESCFDRVFFTSTGAEANEGAIKLARKYGSVHKGGAADIITTRHGFHGRTLTTMAATGKEHWEPLFEPKSRGFHKAEYNDVASVEALVSPRTCAVMLEPVQGEGGVNVAEEAFIRKLRRLCDEERLLLIFDEVQTGMGRTGRMFCYQHYGVEPDIMTLGKGIGGGFPLAAMLTTERLNIFEPGEQGGTYTGQPLAMAAGLAVLREMREHHLVENCAAMGDFIREKLTRLAEAFEVTRVRGMGLLIAFDLEKTNAADLVAACMADGLILNACSGHSVRLIPPLIVAEEHVDRMIGILQRHLERG